MLSAGLNSDGCGVSWIQRFCVSGRNGSGRRLSRNDSRTRSDASGVSIRNSVPLLRVTLGRCLSCGCDVECVESRIEPLTVASRPSLRRTADLVLGRGSYRPHLAVISAPPSTLPAGTLIGQQSRAGRVIKRSGDIVFSLALLGLGSPVFLFLALLVKLSSPGPVFYVQRRVGRGYRRFGCIKFRTMRPDADAVLARVLHDNPALQSEYERDFKLKRDPRITPIGRFLRRSSLDELPQFLNVLRGEMSVVGPRPIVDKELNRYGPYMDEVAAVRPGLTGLWQVSGRNNLSYKKRVKLDLAYARGRSFFLDLAIILRTFGVLLLPMDRGAY